jgi:uncharacterized membrane protein
VGLGVEEEIAGREQIENRAHPLMSRLRLITRIALFSALVYVTSWSLVVLPNIKVSFFIMFLAGLLWGAGPGILVGIVGTALWSLFNPYGPVALPILLAQMVGSALCGIIGALARSLQVFTRPALVALSIITLCGLTCVIVYYTPVNVADAWIFKPFWPRFIASLPWTLIALCANALIFPLLFPVARLLYDKEKLAV